MSVKNYPVSILSQKVIDGRLKNVHCAVLVTAASADEAMGKGWRIVSRTRKPENGWTASNVAVGFPDPLDPSDAVEMSQDDVK